MATQQVGNFLPLSGSGSPAQGTGIVIAATVTPGTTIHTSNTASDVIHRIWCYASNIHTADVLLTIEWGDATGTHNIIQTIPAKAGLFVVVPGLALCGTGSVAATVKAFAGTTNVINITGGYIELT